MNKGRWNDRQIISLKWIDKSTKKQSNLGELLYGYLWWVIDDRNNCYAAIGDGGNIIYVNYENKMVIAITSRFKPRAKDRVELIRKRILPQLEISNQKTVHNNK